MNDSSPSTPPDPPQINLLQLWLSLLTPVALTALSLVIMMDGSGEPLSIISLSILSCMVWFIFVMKKRYKGSSLVFLGFGYLIAEVVVCGATFFIGCLSMLSAL